MTRTTISLPDDLDRALRSYVEAQDVPPSVTAVAQEALREFLASRGYLDAGRRLRLTPAKQGSGSSDTSIDHDRILAER